MSFGHNTRLSNDLADATIDVILSYSLDKI
jgi:hypothetical protein